MARDKRPDDAPTVSALDFPAPASFGAPTVYLVVSMNARGEAHMYSTGDTTQTLYLGAQGLNWAISSAVVGHVLQGSIPLEIQASWPKATNEGNS